MINATNATETSDTDFRKFTFTKWRFDGLKSDLCSFKIGRAVAASSAYPAFFNYSTLSRYEYNADDGEYQNNGYVHLFDAGASDNLAIGGLLETMDHLTTNDPTVGEPDQTGEASVIIVVDAQNGFNLRSSKQSDPGQLLTG